MMDTQEAALALEEIAEQMKELIHEAASVLRSIPPEAMKIRARAEAYWYPHILGAIDSEHGYTGGSMTTMADTISELNEW